MGPGVRALVVTAGPAPVGPVALPPADLVVAADGGAERAAALGLVPDVLVGDMDSINPAALGDLEAAGVRVVRHPADKDETDLELAMAEAIRLGATSVTVLTDQSGRPDHAFANLLVAASDRWADTAVDVVLGPSRAWVVRSRLDLAVPIGSTVSLLSLGGPACGVVTSGLRWPLAEEALEPGSGRGLSNEVVSTPASVCLESGTLLVLVP